MLVLRRKVGQVLHIGDHIRLTVLDLDSHTVSVGIDAPRDVNIVREEVLDRHLQKELNPAREVPK